MKPSIPKEVLMNFIHYITFVAENPKNQRETSINSYIILSPNHKYSHAIKAIIEIILPKKQRKWG